MKSRAGFYILLTALSLTGLFSCLGSNNYDYELSPDAQLVSFSLSHDSLAVLATTKFSIDQARSLIYNHDSLPYLTDTAAIASQAIVTYAGGSGSTFAARAEYLDGDTAWVASGDTLRCASLFYLKVYAPDETSKIYTVRVNVHEVDPDSVQYHRSNMAEIPEINLPDWAAFCPAGLDVVAYLGFLHPDKEEGLSLIVNHEGELRFAFIDESATPLFGEKVPDNFPLSAFSIFNDQSFADRLTVISSMQSVWATENGLYWTNLFATKESLPEIEGGNVFSYNDEIWFINGKIVNGGYNSKIYVSRDGGVVWKEKPEKTQPPVEFPLRQDASVVVDEDGKYFYISGGRNQAGLLNDVWKVALNSKLFEN
jgi:hypothetical protein